MYGLPMHQRIIYLSTYLYIYPHSISPCVYISTYLSTLLYPPICLLTYPCVHPLIYLFMSPFIHLSLCDITRNMFGPYSVSDTGLIKPLSFPRVRVKKKKERWPIGFTLQAIPSWPSLVQKGECTSLNPSPWRSWNPVSEDSYHALPEEKHGN